MIYYPGDIPSGISGDIPDGRSPGLNEPGQGGSDLNEPVVLWDTPGYVILWGNS